MPRRIGHHRRHPRGTRRGLERGREAAPREVHRLVLDLGELPAQALQLVARGGQGVVLLGDLLPESVEGDVLVFQGILETATLVGDPIEGLLLLTQGVLQGLEILLHGLTLGGRGGATLRGMLALGEPATEARDLLFRLLAGLLQRLPQAEGEVGGFGDLG